MSILKINGEIFYNMMVNASNTLEEQKEYVNSLNVFPVPDGDTGTNMSMTFKAAVEEIKNLKNEPVGKVAKALAKGALMGARGNSGVILSQILRGFAKGLEDKIEVDVKEFAESIMEGAKSAYKAVMRPTEGTILTIVRAAGESAVNSSATDAESLMNEVYEHSKNTLNKTPEMLPVLKAAKVVDAGGMGFLIILQGMKDALLGNIKVEIEDKTVIPTKNEAAQYISEEDIKFAYCTEFIILSKDGDSNAFKNEIEPLGDSIIAVAYEDVIKVHIHTNDPGAVLSKAVKLGELTKIKIENMKEQHRHLVVEEELVDKEVTQEEAKKYGFVSVAMGEGIINIFKDLGVDIVIEGGQTMNPSTQDILDAINKINAENIFVLPNNKNIVMAASQAVEISEKNVIVIPSKTIPQGITALTVFNSEAEVEENKEAMIESLANVTTASVTYAVRDTEMDGKEIKEGDILGLIEGKISEVGTDVYEVCEKLLENTVNEDSELITILYGKECDENKVNDFIEKIEEKYSDLDVQAYNGNQPLYYFIISVE
ncbi:MAG: DAK2 domain-containing protein [Clostridiales bacterium]|uniref:DAK2 domain-containing protein n=1 Tax=Clostridium sp. N3C TaxID=1776758 RepID=UPI00092DED8A|nr:DAK2 domain-containing protein [Clostridium sp. N3C]NLZ49822.1 DAK2 domain-containing protein [Clostridiales bacterium]SCN22005.1 dihydroxyacetone kinase [Clostridium sp. N3C]